MVSLKKDLLLFCCWAATMVYGQAQNCEIHLDSFHRAISWTYADYNRALFWFQKLANCPSVTSLDYINAAEVAFLRKEVDLAVNYLDKAREKGWVDKKYILERDNCAKYANDPKMKAFLARIDAALAPVLQYFEGIDIENYTDLVPFQVKRKWGYMRRSDKKVMVKPIFEFTDFAQDGKLLVKYNGNWVYISSPQYAEVNNIMNPMPAIKVHHIGYTDDYEPPKKTNLLGFELLYGRIVAISDKFLSAKLLRDKEVALVLTKDSLYGIVRPDGTFIKGFEPIFESLETLNDKIIGKKRKESFYHCYNFKKEIFLPNKILSWQKINQTQSINVKNIEKLFYIGDKETQHYLIIQTEIGYNIFSMNYEVMLLEKFYDKIWLINGARESEKGLLNNYFALVEEKGNLFYLDLITRIAYKP